MFGTVGMFDQQKAEGVDFILLRKRKSLFGGRKNWPHDCDNHRTTERSRRRARFSLVSGQCPPKKYRKASP